MIVIEGDWCDRLIDIGDRAPDLTTVVIRGAASVELPERFVQVALAELLRPSDHPEPVIPAVSDVASILFTSGTSGPSKGVLCPHGLVYSAASFPPFEEPEVALCALPLFHMGGLWASVILAFRCGGTAIVVDGFSVSRFWGQRRQYKATVALFVGCMPDMLLNQPASDLDRKHTLRVATITPAPRDAEGLTSRFGFEVISAYGMTETGTVTIVPPGNARPNSLGRPRPGFEVKLVGTDDTEVPAGIVGEIVDDEIKAVIVVEDGCTLDPAEMLQDLATRMPYFMVPRYYEIVTSLPRTLTQKVQKAEFRRAGVTATTWDAMAAGYRVTRDGLVTPSSSPIGAGSAQS